MQPNTLTLTMPDDWHIHLRDGEALSRTVPDISAQAGRAMVMPNLPTPITTVAAAIAYRDRIMEKVPTGIDFTPCMTLYMTDHLTPTMIAEAKKAKIIQGIKLYPAGATTHSNAGITDILRCTPLFEAMERHQMPLLIHGESTDPNVDVFDREKVFIDTVLTQIIKDFPSLRIVLEHITTKDAVDFVSSAPKTVAATITAHHLHFNRNALFTGGIRPHYYCLPVLKRKHHQAALIQATISGNPKFFMGSDSAPHAQTQKESACGCAGIYTAHALMPLYAMVFEENQALDKLEGFCSHYGADFYQLPRNTQKMTLTKSTWIVPESLPYGLDTLIPLYATQPLTWKITDAQ